MSQFMQIFGYNKCQKRDSEELMQIRVSPAKRLMLQETESFEGGCKPSRRLGISSSQLWLKTYELKAPTNGHTKKIHRE